MISYLSHFQETGANNTFSAEMKILLLCALGVAAVLASDDFAKANNRFAADIYKELAKTHEHANMLVSPISVEVILALVHAGAEGATAQELAQGLHLPNDKEKVAEWVKSFTPTLQGSDKYTLDSANKIFVRDGYKLQENFKRTAVDVFAAEAENIKMDDPKTAASHMNQWVEHKTQNKIKDLIDPKDIDDDMRTILINAMYFRGNWINSFPGHGTKPQTFTVHNSKSTTVDMMRQVNYLDYYSCGHLKANFLQIPYEGNDVTMTIVLPQDRDGIHDLEKQISDVFTMEHKYENTLVQVELPKFKIEAKTDFKQIMVALGVQLAFTDVAEFPAILENEPLKIKKIIQKAVIEVDEEGTKASVATAVEMPIPISSFYEPPKITEFIADHPFIYYLSVKNVIFFVGKYSGV